MPFSALQRKFECFMRYGHFIVVLLQFSYSFFTIPREERVSAKCPFSCKNKDDFFVGIYLTKKEVRIEDSKKRRRSIHKVVFNGVMGQFRIVFHVHLFENAGPVGADRFYT